MGGTVKYCLSPVMVDGIPKIDPVNSLIQLCYQLYRKKRVEIRRVDLRCSLPLTVGRVI